MLRYAKVQMAAVPAAGGSPMPMTMRRLRAFLDMAAWVFELLVAAFAKADGDPKKDKKPKEPTAAQQKIAKAIATGHAYEKHVVEEKLFPEVKNKNDFTD